MFTIQAIHHVGLVVRDLAAAERFYGGVLGLLRHPTRPSWFVLNATSTLHLIPLDLTPFRGTSAADPPYHAYRHVALQVADLRAALRALLAGGVLVSQVGFDGDERVVASADGPLDFGVGSLFVRDPDGNLIEFLQLGHGIFTADARAGAPG
jgi:catechol 2,3-dioxygenase-like lactoylglutathione lyase family enzyme